MNGLAQAVISGLYRPTSSPTGVMANPWEFNVKRYGAKGDDSTDDTAAINAAVTAATAYALSSGTFYAEVVFPVSLPYVLSSATTKGGAGLGNSQIPLPVQAGTDHKITLVFRGCYDAAAMPHWLSSSGVGMRWGSTLRTTLTGQSSDSNWGTPNIIGGPSTTGALQQFAGLFNNVCLTMEGIGILTPINPSIGGVDLRSLAQCVLRRSSVMADGSPTQINATRPTSGLSLGFFTPWITNNDRVIVEDCSVYGQYTAFGIGEHAWVNRTASIYTHDGIYIYCDRENIHSSAFGSLSVEASVNGILCASSQSYGAPINIAAISMELISGAHILDSNNGLCGTAHVTKLDGPTGLVVTGASNLRIVNANQDLGPFTAPAVPATTVAYRNVFYTDCDVLVSANGATITDVAIDGVSTGLIAGWFPVRSAGTIALTYSGGTPTWKWWGR